MRLQVLLVEDEPSDLRHYQDDLPSVFEECDSDVDIHPCDDFGRAYEFATSPARRFDLIVSDTYRGNPKDRNADVLRMVNRYRKGRFCPLVVYSSGVQPPELKDSPFVVWADKGKTGDIERAIRAVLKTGIPQLAHRLHDELDQTAGGYLWDFLEKKWDQLSSRPGFDRRACERLIRRRAAVRLADLVLDSGRLAPISEVDGIEYYIYPQLDVADRSLGEIVRRRRKPDEIRVLLTPHCHLTLQPGQNEPRASYVLTVGTRCAEDVLGAQKLQTLRESEDEAKRYKKLKSWATPPSDVGKPAGRYWYLPAFLDIPHSFCDFLLIESIPYDQLASRYERVAVLAPPFAESLQACFVRYYASVGLPDIRPASIEDLLQTR